MVSKIKYDAIKDMVPGDVIPYLDDLPKYQITDAQLIDVLNHKALNKPLIGGYFRDLSPKGIYLFYTPDEKIRYIGQTNDSFYHRLLTQLDTTYFEGYGWNSMISILTCRRLNKPHSEVCEEDHEVDFQEVCTYKLLLIDAGHGDLLTGEEIKRLEKILLKAYRESAGDKLLNNRVGWLTATQWNKTIDELIKNP